MSRELYESIVRRLGGTYSLNLVVGACRWPSAAGPGHDEGDFKPHTLWPTRITLPEDEPLIDYGQREYRRQEEAWDLFANVCKIQNQRTLIALTNIERPDEPTIQDGVLYVVCEEALMWLDEIGVNLQPRCALWFVVLRLWVMRMLYARADDWRRADEYDNQLDMLVRSTW